MEIGLQCSFILVFSHFILQNFLKKIESEPKLIRRLMILFAGTLLLSFYGGGASVVVYLVFSFLYIFFFLLNLRSIRLRILIDPVNYNDDVLIEKRLKYFIETGQVTFKDGLYYSNSKFVFYIDQFFYYFQKVLGKHPS